MHGTFINGKRLKAGELVSVANRDVITLGKAVSPDESEPRKIALLLNPKRLGNIYPNIFQIDTNSANSLYASTV
jgi:hypothetical protein